MRAPGDHRLADPNGKTRHLDSRLLRIVQQASRFLPAGWRLEVISGGLAIDVQLVDPRGHYIPNTTRQQSGNVYDAYKKLADLVFHTQRLLYPELAERLAWGGKFTLASGEWDVMHFDLGGFRGRGRYQPPAGPAPEIMIAELGGGDEPPAAA